MVVLLKEIYSKLFLEIISLYISTILQLFIFYYYGDYRFFL